MVTGPTEELRFIRFHTDLRVSDFICGKLAVLLDTELETCYIPEYCQKHGFSYVYTRRDHFEHVESTPEILAEWALEIMKYG